MLLILSCCGFKRYTVKWLESNRSGAICKARAPIVKLQIQDAVKASSEKKLKEANLTPFEKQACSGPI